MKTYQNCLILLARDVTEKSTVGSMSCAQIQSVRRSTQIGAKNERIRICSDDGRYSSTTCLVDFTGHSSAARAYTWVAEIQDIVDSEEWNRGSAKTKIHPAINTVSIREDGLSFKSIPSLTTQGGSTAKKADTQYTGSSMIGVSIVHKSHLSPVFSNEHAIDLASMRR